MDFSKLFSVYDLQARVRPALLTLFPLVITIASSFPGLYTFGGTLISLTVSCGVIAMMAEYARHRGRALQKVLIVEWGGMPTTLLLRHDSPLDSLTRERCHSFLEHNVQKWVAPTIEEERADSSKANQRYDGAVTWLLEYTRDSKKYDRLFKNNISYGFRRNLLGLKPVGMVTALICLLGNVYLIYRSGGLSSEVDAKLVASASISAFAVLAWLGIVNKAWVKDAGDSYAQCLLTACEQISSKR